MMTIKINNNNNNNRYQNYYMNLDGVEAGLELFSQGGALQQQHRNKLLTTIMAKQNNQKHIKFNSQKSFYFVLWDFMRSCMII